MIDPHVASTKLAALPQGWEGAVDGVGVAETTLGAIDELTPERDAFEESLLPQVLEAGSGIRMRWSKVLGERTLLVTKRDEHGNATKLKIEYRLRRARVFGKRLQNRSQTILVRGGYGEFKVVDVVTAPDGRSPKKVRVAGTNIPTITSHEAIAVSCELSEVVAAMNSSASRHLGATGSLEADASAQHIQ